MVIKQIAVSAAAAAATLIAASFFFDFIIVFVSLDVLGKFGTLQFSLF